MNAKPAACNRKWIMTHMICQHLPEKKGVVHGLHKTKIVNKAAVRLKAKKFKICWIFHSPWVNKTSPIEDITDPSWRWKSLHCIVAPTIAINSRQAIGNSDANGGHFGWIQSLRRFLAMKLRMEVVIVIVEVVMENCWIAVILCTVGCLQRYNFMKCICLFLLLSVYLFPQWFCLSSCLLWRSNHQKRILSFIDWTN